jgi:hypothetical protein
MGYCIEEKNTKHRTSSTATVAKKKEIFKTKSPLAV